MSDGEVAPGLSKVSVLNTSTNPGEVYLIKLGSSYEYADLEADVAAGRFDRFGLDGNDDPSGWDERSAARMPASMSDSILQPFTASTGSWGVVCADFLDLKAFLAPVTIDVG